MWSLTNPNKESRDTVLNKQINASVDKVWKRSAALFPKKLRMNLKVCYAKWRQLRGSMEAIADIEGQFNYTG